MKINEVEAAVGITKKNIRFYEEAGLLQPRRNAANGYRDYSEQDVARLQRIKLLRKLDVPLAEIRPMLEGERTLADGMRRHAIDLERRQNSLAASLEFCRGLALQPGTVEQLDVAGALERLERQEEQGMRFVNIERTDSKRERSKGAVLGAGIFIALMVLTLAMLVWGCLVSPPPVFVIATAIAVPLAGIAVVLVVLYDRLREIQRGEEDAYRDY